MKMYENIGINRRATVADELAVRAINRRLQVC